jgi:2'-hydroxyisoflavone reductase
VSVYAGFDKANDEDSAVGTLADETVEKVDGATYGPLKALAEGAARQVFGSARSTLIRPGLIVGPDDNTDRFTYWPARAARGGRFIAPGSPQDTVQIIDVRDLAEFVLRSIESDVGGTFNVISPPGSFTIGGLIDESVLAARDLSPPVKSEPRWLSADVLAANEVMPWSDMPVWAPSSGGNEGFAATSVARALAAGLRVRPLRETVWDTLRWHLSRPESERNSLKAGLAPQREAELLAKLS